MSEDHPLLDVLTADPLCPVCGHKGTPISDERGIAYRHDGRFFLCRVTAKILDAPEPTREERQFLRDRSLARHLAEEEHPSA